MVKKFCECSAKEQMAAIMALMDQQNAIYDYLQSVWVPLLEQVTDPEEAFHVREPSELQLQMSQYLIELNAKGVESYQSLFL